MRINQAKITRNMFGEVSLPECPWWREVAENIVTMLEKIPPFDYDDMEDFQKRLIVEYWHHYDVLDTAFIRYPNIEPWIVFRQWFMKDATAPEKIRRSSQWLVENGIIELKQRVRTHALETAGKARETIGSSKQENNED